MFDQKTYCPYTGLRSFTEEEAIYFKGRDQHIEEASKQLEERKFLMLTGSSGDGKSSLVYAGIVPYARSGFIKSQFSNWLVADFKPERKPFRNLCESLSSMLGIPNVSTVEAELSHGYSSLVELYKNSNFYNRIDGNDGEQYNDKEKTNLRRQSANLLILADQFEEFFTNPENYFKGKVSQESSLVINLLLETARIAQEENLPIYVVCTMRSDYIGHCSAFRDLPEFIGYSQFFVPRLNRKQLQEVIEEPAVLSGNTISKRLVERLIYDITEGVDQLPILQHALNQIWRAADNGKEEMDLIHYAMVGGMKGNELPDGDKNKFEAWFNELPEKIQACYEHHSLQNVLNTHANKLYATAAEYYNQKNKDNLSDEDVNHLIHNVFVCLTKIDHGRAVRNRMTLREISEITDIDGLTSDKVKNLTAIFRDSSNTLIQPFIDEDGNDPLGEEDLLDISHESLIRNWNSLKSWASEEFNHVNTYRDYKHQVDRWIEHNRSSDYLLPIGTLTHFEDWFKKIEPNKYWINRYNQEIENKEDRLTASAEILDDCKTYLKASAQKHTVTRTVMKLGARKIAIFLGVISILLFSSFYIYEEYSKSDEVVFDKILREGIDIIEDENSNLYDKADFVIEMTRANPENFDLIFDDIKPGVSFELALRIANDFLGRYQYRPHSVLDRSIFLADSLLNQMYSNDQDSILANEFLEDHGNFINTLDIANYLQPSEKWENLLNKHSKVLAEYVLTQLDNKDGFNPEAIYLNNSIELILNHNVLTDEETNRILQHISPLENSLSNTLSELYDQGNLIKVGEYNSQFSHNGLYQELAYIYAYHGNLNKTFQCLDTLFKYNQAYFNNDYNVLIDNGTNIAYYLLFDKDLEAFNIFVSEYCSRSGIQVIDFLDKFWGRSIIAIPTNNKRNDFDLQNLHNNNTGLMSDEMRMQLFDLYENEILKIKNADERNFRLALLHKHLGLFSAQRQMLLSGLYDMDIIAPMYDKALEHFNMVSDLHLAESTQRMYWGARTMQSERKDQFIFPGYLENQMIWTRRAYSFHYFNTSFLEYLTTQGLVSSMYSDQEDIALIDEWTSYILGISVFKSRVSSIVDVDYGVTAKFLDQLLANDNINKATLTGLKVLTAVNLFEMGEDSKAIEIADEVELANLKSTLTGITGGVINEKYQNIGLLGYHLIRNDKQDEFNSIIDGFDMPTHKATLVAYAATRMGINKNTDECKKLISRAKDEDRKKTTGDGWAPEWISFALQLLPNLEGYEESRKIWKNTLFKGFANQIMARNLSLSGYAWRSHEDIDELTPPRNRFNLYTRIGQGMRLHKNLDEKEEWSHFDRTNPGWWDRLYYFSN